MMAVDDQSEISFLSLKGCCHSNQFLGFIARVLLDAGRLWCSQAG